MVSAYQQIYSQSKVLPLEPVVGTSFIYITQQTPYNPFAVSTVFYDLRFFLVQYVVHKKKINLYGHFRKCIKLEFLLLTTPYQIVTSNFYHHSPGRQSMMTFLLKCQRYNSAGSWVLAQHVPWIKVSKINVAIKQIQDKEPAFQFLALFLILQVCSLAGSLNFVV